MCLLDGNPMRDASRALPPNQFYTLSPPRHCDVIHSSVSSQPWQLCSLELFILLHLSFSLPLILCPSPSPDPSEPSPLTPSEGVQLHPQPHKHPPPYSLLLHLRAGGKRTSRRVQNTRRGGAWIHLMQQTRPEDSVVKQAYFCQGRPQTQNWQTESRQTRHNRN